MVLSLTLLGIISAMHFVGDKSSRNKLAGSRYRPLLSPRISSSPHNLFL